MKPKGNPLLIGYKTSPDYFAVRRSVEEEENAVLIALGGSPGVWLAVDGFSQWRQSDGSYLVNVSDPFSSAVQSLPMRNSGSISEIYFNSAWHTIDKMIEIGAVNWAVSRTLLGTDNNTNDGWSFDWTPVDLVQNQHYFFRTEGIDAGSLKGYATILINFDCSQNYIMGDYDNDGVMSISDLIYMVNYFLAGGSEPYGGGWRCDANCDSVVNIADLIYIVNYIFGVTVTPPCY